MQRAFSIAAAFVAVALAALMAWKSAPPMPSAVSGSVVMAAEGADAGGSASLGRDAGLADAGGANVTGADASEALEIPGLDLSPPAAGGTPKHVRFGVILVGYEGAQDTSGKSRSKSEALALATKLAEDAKGDFHGAVAHGDTGSTDDVGQVDRGVLEPSSEAVLFNLPVGGVSGAIDTPRGYWIVKRLE